MRTSDIEAAINSTPQMKEDLRKAFEFFQSYSSSISSFTLQWKDLEDHYSSIEKSIEERFRELKEFESSSLAHREQNKSEEVQLMISSKKQSYDEEVEPRPELKALCGNMDGEGLMSFIVENKKDIVDIQRELGSALLSAPDPVSLVLDSLVCFVPPQETTDGKLQSIRRTCASILECLNELAPEITPEARDRAREVAVKWKELIRDGKGDNSIVALCFLRLIGSFGLVESFDVNDILDLIVPLVKRKYIIDLCQSSAFVGKMPDLVEKLTNTGKHLDAVKFVQAFNLQAKYPPSSLLRAYVKESKKICHETRTKGNNSAQSKNLAILKEIDSLKAVMRTVAEYNLEAAYPSDSLQKRIEQLERQKMESRSDKRRGPASSKSQKQLQMTPNKRPRPSDSFAPIFAGQSLAHNPPQHVPVDRAPYAGLAGPYSLGAAPSLYVHGNSSFPADYVPHATANPYVFSSEPHAGAGYYDRAAVNGGYKTGLPAYNPSHYP